LREAYRSLSDPALSLRDNTRYRLQSKWRWDSFALPLSGKSLDQRSKKPIPKVKNKMKTRLLSVAAALALATYGVCAHKALAQNTAEKPMNHKDMGAHHGDHMGPSPDGAFHRRFNDAGKWAKKFDDPERDAWQKPEEILDALHLDRGAKVADLGAGTGYFSVRIAKRIPDGKLFAADVEPDMVKYLGERAKREHLTNLTPVQSSADASNLPEPVDIILVVDTYHHIGYRSQYFAKLKASLRPMGRLAIIDFKADSPDGPPVEHRIPPEKVEQELNAAGYSLIETHKFLPRQYFLVFQKRD
jgi:ubiquinone/menaquinone biosynthesis C-methylase UbiE